MLTISSYFSAAYLAVLLPATVGLYAVLPQKLRRWVLLLASYVFFWAVSGKLILYILWATLVAHYAGLWLDRLQRDSDEAAAQAEKCDRKRLKNQWRRRKRLVLAFGAAATLGVLLGVKYSGFFAGNLNTLMEALNVSVRFKIPAFAQPIGISFYSMQAMAYLFDVYWGKIPAERNLGRMALWLSFFPLLMEGPICRYGETANRLWNAPALQYKNIETGVWRILLGMVKKIVVADRLNRLVQTVFTDYESYDGLVIALGAVCYTVQLYMEFSGTMDLAVGTGEIFGLKLPENFRQPFFAPKISEFWRRWHITLGAWFKDYIFFPVSMSRPVKRLSSECRKRMGSHFGSAFSGGAALLCVWVCNGLWHGAAWQYLFYGLYHFALIWGGNLLEIPAEKLARRLGFNRRRWYWKGAQILRTGILVCFGEMFFASHGLRAGLTMAKTLFFSFSLEPLWDGTLLTLGMDEKDFVLTGVVLLGLFILSLLREYGIEMEHCIVRQNVVLRFAAFYLPVLVIVVFGAYGTGYVPVDPMYAGF